ncbi:hypothetical protein F5887DRAFT_971184 [Amanita rubescens]|nr:hypothetical protein F5887DRAFT_971184 [Amanita rubescens]
MILLPYALLLLVLCTTGVVARPGDKKRKDHRPDDKPQAAALKLPKSHAVAVSSLASMTVDEILALRQVPLRQGMPRIRSEHGHRSIHPVIVMGPAEGIIETKVECVLVLEISNNLIVDKDYQVDAKSLFPPGTKISGMVNAGAYRVVEMNKFVLVPPMPNYGTLQVLREDKVQMLKDRVDNAKDLFPAKKKYYPKWILVKKEDKLKLSTTPDREPLIVTNAPWRRDLLRYLMQGPAA